MTCCLARATARVRERSTPASVIQVDANALNRLLYQYPLLRNQIAPALVVGRLRTLPFLGSLDPITLSFLAEICEQLELQDGEEIYGAADEADEIFVIDEGQVRLSWPAGKESWLGNGMELGILDAGPPRTAPDTPTRLRPSRRGGGRCDAVRLAPHRHRRIDRHRPGAYRASVTRRARTHDALCVSLLEILREAAETPSRLYEPTTIFPSTISSCSRAKSETACGC